MGVSHQYCGAVGQQANCQVSVELVVRDGWVAAPVGGRLYWPASWAPDRARRAAAGVPPAGPFRTKPELGLELIRQALADGVYGDSAEFRQGLRQLGMEFFLQVSARPKAWTQAVATARKRVRHYVVKGTPPAQTLAEIAAALPAGEWKACSWRAADGRARHTRRQKERLVSGVIVIREFTLGLLHPYVAQALHDQQALCHLGTYHPAQVFYTRVALVGRTHFVPSIQAQEQRGQRK